MGGGGSLEGARRFSTALGRIAVGACYTHGARSRRWCGWWERRGPWGGAGADELELRHGSVET